MKMVYFCQRHKCHYRCKSKAMISAILLGNFPLNSFMWKIFLKCYKINIIGFILLWLCLCVILQNNFHSFKNTAVIIPQSIIAQNQFCTIQQSDDFNYLTFYETNFNLHIWNEVHFKVKKQSVNRFPFVNNKC